MLLLKRRTSLTAFLAVWLTVETVLGPAPLWAQPDTLRPLNRQEDRSGLEELTRKLAPDAVNPAAAGLEEKFTRRDVLKTAGSAALGAVTTLSIFSSVQWWLNRRIDPFLIINSQNEKPPVLTDLSGFQIVSDTDSRIETAILQAGDGLGIHLGAKLAGLLHPEVRILVLAPNRRNARLAYDRFVEERVPQIEKRIRFLIMDEQMLSWGRDPYTALANPRQQQYALLPARTTLDKSNQGLTAAQRLAGSDLGFPLFLAQDPLGLLDIHGGDLVSDTRYAYVGRSSLRHSNIFMDDRELRMPVLQKLIGRDVIPLEMDPFDVGRTHADTYFAALGATPAGMTTVVLGDIDMTQRILKRLTPKEREEAVRAIQNQLSGWENSSDRIRKITVDRLKDFLSGRLPVPGIYERALNNIASNLTQKGIAVRRVPYLPPKEPFGVFYSNVILDSRSSPNGTIERSVIMPVYGIEPLDRAAEAVYQELGYRVERFPGVVAGAYDGGPRCLCQRLAVPFPKSGLEEGQLRQHLEQNQYPGGPIQLIVDAFAERKADVVVLADMEEWVENTPYDQFLKRLVEELAKQTNVRKVLIENQPGIVEQEVVPILKKMAGTEHEYFLPYAMSSGNQDLALAFSVARHLWPMLRRAFQLDFSLSGFDPRPHANKSGEMVGNRSPPMVGGATEEGMRDEILKQLKENGQQPMLVIAGGNHVPVTEGLNRLGRLLSQAEGIRTETIGMDVGWVEAEERQLAEALYRTDLPMVAIADSRQGPLGDLQYFRGGVLVDWDGNLVSEGPEQVIPVRAKDFTGGLIYFRSENDIVSYLKGYAAGLEEKSQDLQWKRTHAKIIKALRSHPGGRLMATELARRTGLGRVALYTHGYRSLVAAENKRRARMKRPTPAIELREYQEHTKNPEQAIVKALRSHPGGRMTVEELAKLADVGKSTLYNYGYRSLVAADNERRAGMKRSRPAIILLEGGRPRSAAGLEEKGWADFETHLGKLEAQRRPVARKQAAEAILNALEKNQLNTSQKKELVRRIGARLDDAGSGEKNTEVRELIMQLLTFAEPLHPAVKDRMRRFLADPTRDPALLAAGLNGWDLALSHRRAALPRDRFLEFLPKVLPLVESSNAFLADRAVYFLAHLLFIDALRSEPMPGANKIKKELLRLAAPDIFRKAHALAADQPNVRLQFERILQALGQEISSLTARRPVKLERTLASEELGRLRKQISEKGNLPVEVYRGLLSDPKRRVVFVDDDGKSSLWFPVNSRLFGDLLAVAEENEQKILLLLPLPGSLSKDLKQFVARGEISGSLLRGLYWVENSGEKTLPDSIERADQLTEAKHASFLDWLDNLYTALKDAERKSIFIELYGEEVGQDGEVAFDQKAGNLQRFLADSAYADRKMVVYSALGELERTQSRFSKVDLDRAIGSPRDRGMSDRSLRIRLLSSSAVNPEQVVSVLDHDVAYWEMMKRNRLHNLSDLIPRIPSFGLWVQESGFAKLRFDVFWKQTHGEAWDILVVRNRKDGDRDFFQQPTFQEPDANPIPPVAPEPSAPRRSRVLVHAGLEEEVHARVERFVRELAGERGLTPVVIGAALEAAHPELRVLSRLKELPVLFAGGLEEDQVVVELITRWNARNVVFAGTEEEAGRFIPILAAAGIKARAVTPESAGHLILAILAQAAGMEERDLAGRAGQFLDDLTALAGQV